MENFILVEEEGGKQSILNLDNVAYITPEYKMYEKGEFNGSNVYFNRANDEGNPIVFNVPFEQLVQKLGLT